MSIIATHVVDPSEFEELIIDAHSHLVLWSLHEGRVRAEGDRYEAPNGEVFEVTRTEIDPYEELICTEVKRIAS